MAVCKLGTDVSANFPVQFGLIGAGVRYDNACYEVGTVGCVRCQDSYSKGARMIRGYSDQLPLVLTNLSASIDLHTTKYAKNPACKLFSHSNFYRHSLVSSNHDTNERDIYIQRPYQRSFISHHSSGIIPPIGTVRTLAAYES